MNLDVWKIFYEVANIGNISKASRRLHISQPAVTKQIQNLEEYLNCKLFIRSQKGVLLTKEGEIILNDIKNGLNSFELAEKKIQANNQMLTGIIRIGISTTLAKTYLMPYIRDFHAAYPNIVFEISTDPTTALKVQMKKGKIDFILAKFPSKIIDDFQYTKIGEMQDIFVVNESYKALLNKKLKLQDLTNYPILLQKNPSSSREFIEKFCLENEVLLNSVMEIASSNLLIEFAKIGYGIGVVTKEYVKKELINQELFELEVIPKISKRDFGIISLDQNYLSKGSMEFLKSLGSFHKL